MAGPNLRNQRALAAKIKKVGKNKIWIDPNSIVTVAAANSTSAVKKLIKEGTINVPPSTIRSRYSANQRKLEKKKGRHSGLGCRKGAKNARMNLKALHYHKVRALRNTLKKQFCLGKISAGEKRTLGKSISGNCFKTRKALIEQIIKNKNAAKETKATIAEKERLTVKSENRRAHKQALKLKQNMEKISQNQRLAVSSA